MNGTVSNILIRSSGILQIDYGGFGTVLTVDDGGTAIVRGSGSVNSIVIKSGRNVICI